MRGVFIFLAIVGVVLLGLFVRRANASVMGGSLGVDPRTGKPYDINTTFGKISAGIIPFSVSYPPNSFSNPAMAVTAPGSGSSLSSYCQKIYGGNSQLISKVPDKNAKYVSQANSAVAGLNCGAVAIAEKAVGAVIVTPAKAVYKATLGKLF